MKKLILILLLLPFLCNAQSIKNLDIKNGFLQFHFGDTITNYKTILHADRSRPGYYLVAHKAVKLKSYLDQTFLYFPKGILEGVELKVHGESNADFLNKTMHKVYGEPSELKDTLGVQKNYHTTYAIWKGQKVIAIVEKNTLDLTFNDRIVYDIFETITFRRANDSIVEGELSPDFPL
jgi:hypothetical protein